MRLAGNARRILGGKVAGRVGAFFDHAMFDGWPEAWAAAARIGLDIRPQ
jgi:hypothetical protein